MARLFEYQSKTLLKQEGIPIPAGEVAATPEDARRVAEKIGRPVVLKIQVWVTGRARLGGIQPAENPAEAEEKARRLFGMKVGISNRNSSPGLSWTIQPSGPLSFLAPSAGRESKRSPGSTPKK
jgi:succinyl-CoA synthetase beta subunit